MGRTKKKQEIWGKVLTEKGYMRVPRVLRLKRAELGISNNEYAILLDYLDYYTYSEGQNPYRHLAQVNGVTERTVQKTLGKLAEKGLIGRSVKKHPSGRTKGVVFTIEPLLMKLTGRAKDPSPTEGEGSFACGGEEAAAPNTRDTGNKSRESKEMGTDRSAERDRGAIDKDNCGDGGERFTVMSGDKDGDGGGPSTVHRVQAQGERVLTKMSTDSNLDYEIGDSMREVRERYSLSDKEIRTTPNAGSEVSRQSSVKSRTSKDPYSPVRWYNEVFSEVYKKASGQPVLSGGREYRAAGTYFSRLKELNPELGPKEIYERAGDGARFMLESQARGGVFGWMHCPPDICMLSSQAQAVDYHLRKTVVGMKTKKTGSEEQKPLPAKKEMREQEAEYEPEEITRLYGELRGLGGTGG